MAREPEDADEVEASLIDRRSFLKTTGVVAASAAAVGSTSGTARAATGGYGGGGYGTVAFGMSATVPVTVTTGTAANVLETAATLAGRIDDLGAAGSAEAAFEYRTSESNVWTRTTPTTVTGAGTFRRTVTDLQDGTKYLFRAVATTNGVDHVGGEASFTTARADTSPSIDEFTVSPSERLGDDRMFTVNWTVADPNGDLDTVEVVTVKDVASMNFAVTDVNGASASGWDLFQFPVGTALDVTLRVTDGRGNVTKRTRSVTL